MLRKGSDGQQRRGGRGDGAGLSIELTIMAFRRDSSRHHDWKRWVADHRADLLDAGVPDWILADEMRWLRFLEEGCDYESGWWPTMLDRDHAKNLHMFIQREYGDQQYRGLLREIEVFWGEASALYPGGTTANRGAPADSQPQLPGFAEIDKWPEVPQPPLSIKDFGRYRDWGPHQTVYVVLADIGGHEYHFFFDRFLGRLCFGKNDKDEDAAFVRVGSPLERDILDILDAAIATDETYAKLRKPVARARHWSHRGK